MRRRLGGCSVDSSTPPRSQQKGCGVWLYVRKPGKARGSAVRERPSKPLHRMDGGLLAQLLGIVRSTPRPRARRPTPRSWRVPFRSGIMNRFAASLPLTPQELPSLSDDHHYSKLRVDQKKIPRRFTPRFFRDSDSRRSSTKRDSSGNPQMKKRKEFAFTGLVSTTSRLWNVTGIWRGQLRAWPIKIIGTSCESCASSGRAERRRQQPQRWYGHGGLFCRLYPMPIALPIRNHEQIRSIANFSLRPNSILSLGGKGLWGPAV